MQNNNGPGTPSRGHVIRDRRVRRPAPFRVGDSVRVRRAGSGTVIGVIERNEFSTAVEPSRWRGLKRGVLVRLACGNISHLLEPEFLLELAAASVDRPSARAA